MQKHKANIVDIVNERIFPGIVVVDNGKISQITESDDKYDNYIIPGFIDAHIHIESSMLTPAEFARIAVQHGTVVAVCDPHEIANVLGIEGIEYMIENSRPSPFKFYFSAPSCVPATDIETSGAVINADDIEYLFQNYSEIKFLGEMMNFPGVLNDDPQVMRKIAIAKKYDKPIDGHAPGLEHNQLKKYIDSGITTDHECFAKDEALQKLKLGMQVWIREGSAAKNFNELIALAEEHSGNMAFCSDDKHPDDLIKGHIKELVRRAINQEGLDPIKVLRMATLNPARHYKLDIGILQEGDPADFLVVDNLENLHIQKTVINGSIVYEKGTVSIPSQKSKKINKFNATTKDPDDFIIPAKQGKIDVIAAHDGQLVTDRLQVEPTIKNGKVVSDVNRNILKIALVNRYQDQQPAVAFVKNFGLKKGAIASSVAHDSHNILAVGTNDQDLCKAINLVIENKGGLSAVCEQEDIAEILPLPIAGIMSNQDYQTVAAKYKRIDQLAHKLGSELGAPFMTLSFMALLVIPELKIGDRGLFDVNTFEYL